VFNQTNRGEKMKPRIVIATTMMYDLNNPLSAIRAGLALETVKKYISFGYTILVLDDGIPPDYRALMYMEGAILFDGNKMGMGPGRRYILGKAMEIAGEGGAVIWTEPEKWPFIHCVDKVVAPVLNGQADLVIPRRTEESMMTHPEEQRYIESFANFAFNLMVKKVIPDANFDVWFGPFAANAKALQYFLDYDAKEAGNPDTWDAIHVPRVDAIAAGLGVISVDIYTYHYPQEQRDAEAGNMEMIEKRIQQLQLVGAYRRRAEKFGLI